MVINKNFNIGSLFKYLVASAFLVLTFGLSIKAEHEINIAYVSTFFMTIFLIWLTLTVGYLSILILNNGNKKELTPDEIVEWNKYLVRVMKVGKESSLILFGMFALAALYFLPETVSNYTTGAWEERGYFVVNDVGFMTVIYSLATLFPLGAFHSVFEKNLLLLNAE